MTPAQQAAIRAAGRAAGQAAPPLSTAQTKRLRLLLRDVLPVAS